MSACCSNFGSNKCKCNCWPVDPRAPKKSFASIFDCDEETMQNLQALYEREYDNKNRKMAIIVGPKSLEKIKEIQDLFPQIPEAFKHNRIELVKLEMEQIVVKEENSKYSGKVTQRDQRNRERFNKNRKWK